MKKVIKFLCLLLIAALIAILVLKNGAKADDARVSIEGSESITLNSTETYSISFPYNVTSFSGSISYSGDGEVTFGGGIIEGTGALYYDGGSNNTFSFTAQATQAGSVTISVNVSEVTPADPEQASGPLSGSISITIPGEEPPEQEPSVTIGIDHSTIQVGSEAHISINSIYPEDDTVTYSSSNTDVAEIDQDGKITAKAPGESTITVRTSRGAEATQSVLVKGEDPQPPAGDFEVSPTSITSKGQTYVTPKNGQAGSAVSDNESVATATVVDDGNSVLVDAIGEGEAKITITKKDSSETAFVTVNIQGEQPPTPPTPVEGQTPELSQSSITLNAGGESATIRVTNGVPVEWTSDKPDVVAIAANRTDTETAIISNKSGTATIIATAKDGGKVAKVSVTVNKNEQAAPTITPSGNIRLEVGKSVFLDANQGVNWSSGNSSVASVSSDGTVTAKGVGETRITATNGSGKSSSVTVTVVQASNGGDSGNESNSEEPANPDQGSETTSTFAISPTKTQTLNIGDTFQINVTKGTASSWKSSKPAVATVDNNGKVTANSAGTTIITAVASDGSVAQVKVRVRDENGEVPEPDSESDEDVPSTGEASTELLLVLGVLTCVIAMFIFRKKTK